PRVRDRRTDDERRGSGYGGGGAVAALVLFAAAAGAGIVAPHLGLRPPHGTGLFLGGRRRAVAPGGRLGLRAAAALDGAARGAAARLGQRGRFLFAPDLHVEDLLAAVALDG